MFLSYCHCWKRCDLFLVSWGRPCVLQLSQKLQKRKKKKKKWQRLSPERELLQLRINSTYIRNVSCSYFCKALRGLGFLFPSSRTLTIPLQFQSDNSVSLQIKLSLQGPPLGIKQLQRQHKGCDVRNKTITEQKVILNCSKTFILLEEKKGWEYGK